MPHDDPIFIHVRFAAERCCSPDNVESHAPFLRHRPGRIAAPECCPLFRHTERRLVGESGVTSRVVGERR
jgi:hypothetical protein